MLIESHSQELTTWHGRGMTIVDLKAQDLVASALKDNTLRLWDISQDPGEGNELAGFLHSASAKR